MRGYLYLIIFVLCVTACQTGQKSDPATADADSVVTDSDSVVTDSVASPPKAADGLFEDFIYSFMRSSKFQKSRIVFPLSNTVDSKNQPIAENAWKHDRLYLKEDVYTMIFDSPKAIAAEKDSATHRVVVERVYLNKDRIKQYIFEKREGQWWLTALNTQQLGKSENSDFYAFYKRFSTDTDFQMSHISNPFRFKTYDEEQFEKIEGVLDVLQWPDYSPELPKGTIFNINYAQKYGTAPQRVFTICSPSGGMGCTLTFVRSGKSWKMDCLDN